MRLYLNNDIKNTNTYNKESKKTKGKYHLIQRKEGNFLCTFSISDDGKEVLLSKLPIKNSNTKDILKISNSSNSLFNLDDSKFFNESIISNNRAAFNFNQKSLKDKNHKDDLKEIMNIIKKII